MVTNNAPVATELTEASMGIEPSLITEYTPRKVNAADFIDAIKSPEFADEKTLAQLREKLDSLPANLRKKLTSFFNVLDNTAQKNKNKKEKNRKRNKIARLSRRANRK